jgi:quercetin dioxygenase-like cupin family protein
MGDPQLLIPVDAGGPGHVRRPINVRRVGEDHWKVSVQAKPALDVAVQTIVFQPGGHSGWHSHPGPVFISVVSGTMTFYEGDDPDCEPIVRHAGEGYLDTGDHAHIARNETAEPATNVVTYFAPPGAALRIDQPDPGNCSSRSSRAQGYRAASDRERPDRF